MTRILPSLRYTLAVWHVLRWDGLHPAQGLYPGIFELKLISQRSPPNLEEGCSQRVGETKVHSYHNILNSCKKKGAVRVCGLVPSPEIIVAWE